MAGKASGSKRRQQRPRKGSANDAMGPLQWRKQHHPLSENGAVLARVEIAADGEDGPPAYVVRAADTIDALLKKGRIDQRAAEAAREFEAIFQRASLAGLGNRDLRRPAGPKRPSTAEPHYILSARDEVWRAIAALGGIGTPGANVAWDVLGLGMTIKSHAERCQFGEGRSLNPMTATGLLVQACYTLAAHYGK